MLLKRLLLFAFILYSGLLTLSAQVIYNGDFEENAGCNSNLGQINMLDNWFIVVESADYYSCGFTTPFFPSSGVAASGDAYTGFASYGDATGSAESIGQQMPQPMIIGQEYNMNMALKTPTGGNYSDPCGGLCVYGFVGSPPTGVIANHTSLMPGAVELGCTGLVTNTEWEYYSITFTPNQAFDYFVVTTSLNVNCPQNIFIDNITFDEPITETITACEGEEVIIDPQAGGELIWLQNLDGIYVEIQTSETLTWTTDLSTDIMGVIDGGELFFDIVIVELPTPDLGPDIVACPGDDIEFNAGAGWEEISWNGEVGSQFFAPDEAGIYEVAVTLNGCVGTDEIELIDADAPDFSSLIVTNPGCVGQCNGQLDITLEPDWTFSLDGVVVGNQVIDLCEGDYSLFLTNGFCDASMDLTLTADPLPVIDLPLNYVICEGSEVTMTATSLESDLTYTWDTGTVGASETTIPTEGDTFCVTAIDENGCISLVHCTEIFNYADLSLSSPDDVVPCPSDNLNFLAAATGGDGNYTWEWADENEAVLGASNSLTFTAMEPTVLTVTVADGCTPEGISAEIQVQTVVLPNPELLVSVETECIPVPVSFALTETTEFTAINWNFGDEEFGSGQSVNHTYEIEDCFNIEIALIHNEGCPLNLSFEEVLCAYELPVADFSIREGTIVYNSIEEIHFDNTSQGAVAYNWTVDGTEVSSEESPVIEGWELPGVYEICLEAINEQGCTDFICTEIDVKLLPNVFIPNAFTPDLDGINEVFIPVMNFEPSEFTFEIFNRWGDLVFISNDPAVGWIGNDENGGYYVQSDVYTYQLTVVMPDTGNAELFKGQVTVLR